MPSSILNSDDGVISGTSGLKSSGGDDGVLVFQSKGTETARINTDSQIVAAAGTASLPIYSTTGDLNTGIYFPAADNIGFATGGTIRGRWTTDGLCFGSDTAAANALDDYEEGTWTPSYSPTGSAFSSITYGASTGGRYIKIGKMVFVIFFIQVSSVTGGSGTLRLTGFPFTPEAISNVNPGVVVHLANNWGTNTPFSIDWGGTTLFNVKYRASVSGALDPGDINVTDLNANCFMRGNFCYQASA